MMLQDIRKTILILWMVGASLLAWAQPKVPREVQFAAIGGANMSSYTFAPSVTQDKSLGYLGGFGVRYIEEKYFGLQCELLLAKRGIKDRYDNEDLKQYHFERRFTYVEMPMMAHVYFAAGKRNEIALDMGAKLCYMVNDPGGKGNLDSGFDGAISMAKHGYGHHTLAVERKFDYGIQAGLGYEFKFSRQYSLQLQGRYYFGLGDVFANTKTDTFETSSNQSIQMVVALWFHHRIRYKKVTN